LGFAVKATSKPICRRGLLANCSFHALLSSAVRNLDVRVADVLTNNVHCNLFAIIEDQIAI
jgi:hypothetical protein